MPIFDPRVRDQLVDSAVQELYAKARALDSRRQGEERFSASYVAGYVSWVFQRHLEHAYEVGLLDGVASLSDILADPGPDRDTGNDIEPGDDEGSLAFCFGMAL